MWQRFTERARRIVFFAQEEATRLGGSYVSTEHLLLGLVRESDSVAARVLEQMGVSLENVRSEIERQVARDNGPIGHEMQLTPRAKRVIDLAYDEARSSGVNYIGSEHILLGILREEEGLGARVLTKLGVKLEAARNEVQNLMASAGNNPQASSERPKDAASVLGGLVNALRSRRKHGPLPPMEEEILTALEAHTLAENTTSDEAADQIQALMMRITEQHQKRAQESKNPAEDRAAQSSGPAGTTADLPGKGNLGLLQNPDGSTRVPAAKDEQTLSRLEDITEAKDAYAYRELAAGGTLLELVVGTEVKFLRATTPSGYFVRVESGEAAGQAVWILARTFQHTGPDTRPFPPEA